MIICKLQYRIVIVDAENLYNRLMEIGYRKPRALLMPNL